MAKRVTLYVKDAKNAKDVEYNGVFDFKVTDSGALIINITGGESILLNSNAWYEAYTETEEIPDSVVKDGPHSRACPIGLHDHGYRCSFSCPTCHGKRL